MKEISEQTKICDICTEKIFHLKCMSITSSENENLNSSNSSLEDNKYYNICLDCVEKIKDLLTYNYGFDGDLIKYFKKLVEDK